MALFIWIIRMPKHNLIRLSFEEDVGENYVTGLTNTFIEWEFVNKIIL